MTCVVQARMRSSRLPGKVVADLDGRPMLAFMLNRLRPLAVHQLVVATSDLPTDDPVAEVATASGANVVRGSELDVLDRFRLTLEHFPSEAVVRLTADCPLVDPAVVAAVIERHRATDADYTSNTLLRDFPKGLDVEVMSASALRTAASEASDSDEREHVTPFLYRRPERFRLVALRGPLPCGNERWTVDTSEDLERIRRMVAGLRTHAAGWQDFLSVAPSSGGPGPTQVWLRPAVADDAPSVPTPHDDPGRRIWVCVRNDRPIGWVRVEVIDGKGQALLGPGDLGAETEAEVITALRRVLAQELQVQTLTFAGSGNAP